MSSTWQTLSDVFTVIRTIANKDSTTLSDAVLLPLANKYYFQMFRELADLNAELYAEISYTDLIAGQREYILPVDSVNFGNVVVTGYGGGCVQIQRVEVNYSGNKWKVASSTSVKDTYSSLVTNPDPSRADYSREYPKYFFRDRSIWLLPTPQASDNTLAGNNALYTFWIKRPDELINSTPPAIPELPKDWLAVLQEGILYDVFRKFNRTVDARDALMNWRTGVERMRMIEQNEDEGRKLIMKVYKKTYS
jgi:hypothetical protein